jgi:hypothetical protein
MRKSKSSESRIVQALKQVEGWGSYLAPKVPLNMVQR